MSDFTKSTQDAIEQAKARGLKTIFPSENELQIDIDDRASEDLFWELYRSIFIRYFESGKEPKVTPSKSGGEKKHITVTLTRDVTAMERILLQACLGSDRKRELLSFIELIKGDAMPTLFFEPDVQVPTTGETFDAAWDELTWEAA